MSAACHGPCNGRTAQDQSIESKERRRRETVAIDDPPVEQRRRAISEQADVDDIRQKVSALRDTTQADEHSETQSGRYTTPPRVARWKQEGEGDEREGKCGVAGNKSTVSIAFGCGQRCWGEVMGPAERFDLRGPGASPMIF